MYFQILVQFWLKMSGKLTNGSGKPEKLRNLKFQFCEQRRDSALQHILKFAQLVLPDIKKYFFEPLTVVISNNIGDHGLGSGPLDAA